MVFLIYETVQASPIFTPLGSSIRSTKRCFIASAVSSGLADEKEVENSPGLEFWSARLNWKEPPRQVIWF